MSHPRGSPHDPPPAAASIASLTREWTARTGPDPASPPLEPLTFCNPFYPARPAAAERNPQSSPPDDSQATEPLPFTSKSKEPEPEPVAALPETVTFPIVPTTMTPDAVLAAIRTCHNEQESRINDKLEWARTRTSVEMEELRSQVEASADRLRGVEEMRAKVEGIEACVRGLDALVREVLARVSGASRGSGIGGILPGAGAPQVLQTNTRASSLRSPVLAEEITLTQLAREAAPTPPSKASTSSRARQSSPASAQEDSLVRLGLRGLEESRTIMPEFSLDDSEIPSSWEKPLEGPEAAAVATVVEVVDAVPSNTQEEVAQIDVDVEASASEVEVDTPIRTGSPSPLEQKEDQEGEVDRMEVDDGFWNEDEVDRIVGSSPVKPQPPKTGRVRATPFAPPTPVGPKVVPPLGAQACKTIPRAPKSPIEIFTVESDSCPSSAPSPPSQNGLCGRSRSTSRAPGRTMAKEVRAKASPYVVPRDSPRISKSSSKSSIPSSKKSSSRARQSQSRTQSPLSHRDTSVKPFSKSERKSTIAKLGTQPQVVTLKASDGVKRGNGLWPSFPRGWDKYTMISEELECEMCNGRVHWGCAGVGQVGTRVKSPWHCPDCVDHINNKTTDLILPAPPNRCVRSNCLRRRKVRTVVEKGDEERYHMEKIIGRRAIGRRADKSRIFHYLILWTGWPLNASTWEPRESLNVDEEGNCEAIDTFMAEIEHVDPGRLKKKVALLDEAHAEFDPATGDPLAPLE